MCIWLAIIVFVKIKLKSKELKKENLNSKKSKYKKIVFGMLDGLD